MGGNLTKSGAGVIAEAAVILAEIAQGKTVQMPAVGRIAKGAEVCIMRRDNKGSSAGLQKTVELIHQANDVFDVFNHVNGAYFAERVVAKGKGNVIKVGNDIGIGVCVSINAYSAGIFFDPAADI